MPHLISGVPTPGRQENLRRENLKVPNLEPEIEFFVETFSRELAKYLDFTVHRSVANLPRTPLRPFLSPAPPFGALDRPAQSLLTNPGKGRRALQKEQLV